MRDEKIKKYNELLDMIKAGEDESFLRDNIFFNYDNDYITFFQLEELIEKLSSR